MGELNTFMCTTWIREHSVFTPFFTADLGAFSVYTFLLWSRAYVHETGSNELRKDKRVRLGFK